MNKYLEKIAANRRVRNYAIKQLKSHDLIETAMDIKGRVDDISSLHSKLTSPAAPKNKRKKKNAILTPTRNRSHRKTN